MADPITLMSLLVAGGTVVAQASIEEATREAWQGLKNVVQDVFGRRVAGSLAKLETNETREAGRTELERVLGPIGEEDALAIGPSADRLVVVLKHDPGARAALEQNSIDLDLDVRGDVLLQRIQGANSMNVRSRSDGDFTLTDVSMGRGQPLGN